MILTQILICYIGLVFEISGHETFMDNAIKGPPIIKCDEHLVRLYFETRKPFQGHVYVRGHYNDDDCHRDYLQNKNNFGSMTIPFAKCGMRRARMAAPKGMMMTATIVTSFHRTFVTSMDKAFQVQCFYVEGDQQVTQNLGVSDIPTATLHTAPPMPHCRYDVLQNGAEGSPVSTAKVGDTLYHKWSCKDDFLKEMYCMTIVSCYVDDGSSNSFELIDQNGCAKDPVLLEDLSYYSDLSAGVETVAFKYADKPSVFFQCRVSLSLKHEHENEVCPRPKCNAAEKLRAKRDNRDPFSENGTDSSTPVATFDLDSSKLTILDVDDEYSRLLEQQQDTNVISTENQPNSPSTTIFDFFWAPNNSAANSMCLSILTFSILFSFICLSLLCLIVFCTILLVKRLYKKY